MMYDWKKFTLLILSAVSGGALHCGWRSLAIRTEPPVKRATPIRQKHARKPLYPRRRAVQASSKRTDEPQFPQRGVLREIIARARVAAANFDVTCHRSGDD
jgi:hypothetical protein